MPGGTTTPGMTGSTMREGWSASWAIVTVSPSLTVSNSQTGRLLPGASMVMRIWLPARNA